MVRQRYGEVGNTMKLSLLSLNRSMCTVATDIRKCPKYSRWHRTARRRSRPPSRSRKYPNGLPEAVSQRSIATSSISDLRQPTLNLDLSVLLVSTHTEWELWAVKIHHSETGEIACFAIARTLKMSPGCSSALASRASIGVALRQSRRRYPNTLTQERKLSSNHRSLTSSQGSTSPDMDEASQQPRKHNRSEALTGLNAPA